MSEHRATSSGPAVHEHDSLGGDAGIRRNATMTFIVLATAVAAFSLLQSLIIPVLGQIQESFHTDQRTTSWVLTAYLLSASITTPLLGRIGDAYGKKRVLLFVLAGLTAGSVVSALAPSIGWLIAARVLQGVGGGVIPLSFGIIRDEFPEARTRSAVSVIASIGSLGFGAGIVLAGPIVSALDYRWLFWFPAMATSAAIIGTAAFIGTSPRRGAVRIDARPAVLLSAFLVCLLLAISEGGQRGWTSPPILGLFTAAAVLAPLWILVENRVESPLIDMKMMRIRGVWTANAIAFLLGFGMFSYFGFLPQFFQTPTDSGYGFGASITQSGHLLLPSSILSILMGLISARLVRRTSPRAVLCSGTALTGMSFLLVALIHDEIWQLYLWTSLQGLGSGLAIATMAAVVTTSAPPEQTGVASGMNANIRTIGGSIGTAVVSGLVTAHIGAAGYPLEVGYTIGFVTLSVALLAASLVALFVPAVEESSMTRAMGSATENAELSMIPGGQVATTENEAGPHR